MIDQVQKPKLLFGHKYWIYTLVDELSLKPTTNGNAFAALPHKNQLMFQAVVRGLTHKGGNNVQDMDVA